MRDLERGICSNYWISLQTIFLITNRIATEKTGSPGEKQFDSDVFLSSSLNNIFHVPV
jgi:hypothetical protein